MNDLAWNAIASCALSLDSKEMREWAQLLITALGGYLAFSTFRQNLRQRRVENALKFIALFREGLKEGDLEEWEELFIYASEPAGWHSPTSKREESQFRLRVQT